MTVKQSLIDEAREILAFTKSKDIKYFCEGVIEFLEYNFIDDEIQRKCYERGGQGHGQGRFQAGVCKVLRGGIKMTNEERAKLLLSSTRFVRSEAAIDLILAYADEIRRECADRVTSPAVMEQLAVIEHSRWSGQAKSALYEMANTMRERWGRLVEIECQYLDEANKELDRIQVKEYLPIICAAILGTEPAQDDGGPKLRATMERLHREAKERKEKK